MKKSTKILIASSVVGAVTTAALVTLLVVLLKKKNSSTTAYPSGQNGFFTMFFTNQTLKGKLASVSGVKNILLKVGKLELVSQSGRIETLYPKTTSTSGSTSTVVAPLVVDLMNIGQLTPLFLNNVQADVYTQVRIVSPEVASGTTDSNVVVVLTDNTQVPVTLPSGSTSGFKLLISKKIDLKPNTAIGLAINLDVSKSLVVTGNGKYILKPVVKTLLSPATNASSSSQ
jgi:hypothetical protein